MTLAPDFRLTCPSIYRYFDLLQHDQVIAEAAKEAGFTDIPVKIDTSYPLDMTKEATKEPRKQAAKSSATATTDEKVPPKLNEKQQKKSKGDQPKENKQKPAPTPVTKEEPIPSMIDLRVGLIKEVKKHPDADTLVSLEDCND